jgi:ABC-type nitrate/sulfonate/bicarbonate transport system substrate-binding protein
MKPAKAVGVGATVLMVAIGVAAVFWLRTAPAPSPEKITVGASGGSDVGAMDFVAEAQGYFRDNGLDVTIK